MLTIYTGVDPSSEDNRCLFHAFEQEYMDSFELLLQDKRVNPAARDNGILNITSVKRHIDDTKYSMMIEMLLQDGRVDINTNDNKFFVDAMNEKRENLIRVLLQDERIKNIAEDLLREDRVIHKDYLNEVRDKMKKEEEEKDKIAAEQKVNSQSE